MQILEVIKRHGYNQVALANAMGISKATLSLTIKRDSTTVETLRRMAQTMGANITEFFEDEVEQKPMPEFVDTITIGGKKYGIVPIEE